MQNTNPVRPNPRQHEDSTIQTADHRNKKNSPRGPFGWIALGLAVLVIAILAFIAIGIVNNQPKSLAVKNSVKADKYQAVFLTNGQVYFGKIRDITEHNINIEEVYYLQVQDPVQPADKNKEQSQNLSLLKLGGEIHGPEDKMVITREQTLFWENLKDDGKVVQAIKQAKK